MGNYKPYGHRQITVGTVTTPIGLDDTIKTLYYGFGGTNTTKSLFDTTTNLVYTPATGKEYIIYGLILIGNATASWAKAFVGLTLDSTETPLMYMYNPTAGVTEYSINQITIPATDYLTIDAGSTNVLLALAIGIERET